MSAVRCDLNRSIQHLKADIGINGGLSLISHEAIKGARTREVQVQVDHADYGKVGNPQQNKAYLHFYLLPVGLGTIL